MQKTFAQIIEAMGGRVRGPVETDGAKAIATGGSIIHEVGGAIMGADVEELGYQQVVSDLGREESISSPTARLCLRMRTKTPP